MRARGTLRPFTCPAPCSSSVGDIISLYDKPDSNDVPNYMWASGQWTAVRYGATVPLKWHLTSEGLSVTGCNPGVTLVIYPIGPPEHAVLYATTS